MYEYFFLVGYCVIYFYFSPSASCAYRIPLAPRHPESTIGLQLGLHREHTPPDGTYGVEYSSIIPAPLSDLSLVTSFAQRSTYLHMSRRN